MFKVVSDNSIIGLRFLTFLIITITFVSCTMPYQKNISFNEPIDENLSSTQDLISLAILKLENNFSVAKKDLSVGKIVMHLDAEKRGEIIITFANKSNNTIKYEAYFNTAKNIFTSIYFYSNEPKVITDEIDVDSWKIDSTAAISVAEEAFFVEPTFKYDEIMVTTSLTYQGLEIWNVHFFDNTDSISYDARINAYTGSIVSTNVR